MVSRLTGIFKRRKMPRDCEEVRNLSSDYIDGELDQGTEDKVKSHLEWCPPCRAFIKTLRATVDLLRATPRRKAPDDFRQHIHENIQNDPRH